MTSIHSVYLDYNATAPLYPEVREVMYEALEEIGNPSSQHHYGRLRRSQLNAARGVVADFFEAQPENIIFTSSGSEANNLALVSYGEDSVFASAIEHLSVLKASPFVQTISVSQEGILDLKELDEKLKQARKPCLVSVMLAHNETGILQPLREIVRVAHKQGALVHTDAIQAAGKIPLSFKDLGVDLMTVSAHKMGGPLGVGVLIVKEGVFLKPLIQGGGQEKGRRAGTENLASILGFAKAIEVTDFKVWQRLSSSRDFLESALEEVFPSLQILGKTQERLPQTSCYIMPGIESAVQLMHFDLHNIAVSSGSACSSGTIKSSHALKAMGLKEEEARCALRVSLGWKTQEQDINSFLKAAMPFYQKMLLRKGNQTETIVKVG